MLFNYKREGYLAGRGSIVMEVLPKEIKEDVVTEGNIYCLEQLSFKQKHFIEWNAFVFLYKLYKCKLVLLHDYSLLHCTNNELNGYTVMMHRH